MSFQSDHFETIIDDQNKQIKLLNESVLNRNRLYLEAKELLEKWVKGLGPVEWIDVISETQEFLNKCKN